MKSEAAQVAALIKEELRKEWPSTKFSVRSEYFANGNAVRVSYTLTEDGPTLRQVERVTNKYQSGWFDGMTDMYNYDPDKTGPTAKYITVSANSHDLCERHKQAFLNYYGLQAFDDQEIMAKLGMWKEQALHRFVMDRVLGQKDGVRV